ncbi:putative syndecan-4 [Scophthalmus maximus]|uniref:Syndecan n=1 Tax=Scophthalmus maximus TaxID=52904 RepID=A0A2U9BEH8_SCOMX|nr:syndecan-4 isoform X2 [Scophthalmus maximus]AWP02354.1 putative syndecan-4 [Scophthalmus maximus]
MLHLCLVLILSASVFSESVRETETWMPMKTTQTAAMSTHHADLESSGGSPNGSDFGFTDDEDEDDDDDYNDYDDVNRDYTDTLYDDEDEYGESSGSGDGATTASPEQKTETSVKPDVHDNKIPEAEPPVRPTVNEVDIVQKSNEIPSLRKEPEPSEEFPSNVLMAHAGDDSILNKTEVLAALIAGCAVGLMFAVLLILLLVYRMKKKDEGSYDLGKKPIYKKAPTTEIYA